jgi:hypothetical protein
VVEGFQRLRDAGATSVIAVPLQGQTVEQLDALSALVLPQLA